MPRPPRNPGVVGVASGAVVVSGGRAVAAPCAPAPACLCPTDSRSLRSVLYPRNPNPTTARSAGRLGFLSHAMLLLLPSAYSRGSLSSVVGFAPTHIITASYACQPLLPLSPSPAYSSTPSPSRPSVRCRSL